MIQNQEHASRTLKTTKVAPSFKDGFLNLASQFPSSMSSDYEVVYTTIKIEKASYGYTERVLHSYGIQKEAFIHMDIQKEAFIHMDIQKEAFI